MIWYIGDTHFSHVNVMKYNNRIFDSVENMDEHIISQWNKYVLPKDEVKFLGDFAWKHPKKYLDRLNGKIDFIIGNHDRNLGYIRTHKSIRSVEYIDISKIKMSEKTTHVITCCHYCMRVWPQSHYNSFHVFAHSHGGLPPIGKSIDVGIDANFNRFGEYRPIAQYEIVDILEKAPDNFNYIKRKGVGNVL